MGRSRICLPSCVAFRLPGLSLTTVPFRWLALQLVPFTAEGDGRGKSLGLILRRGSSRGEVPSAVQPLRAKRKYLAFSVVTVVFRPFSVRDILAGEAAARHGGVLRSGAVFGANSRAAVMCITARDARLRQFGVQREPANANLMEAKMATTFVDTRPAVHDIAARHVRQILRAWSVSAIEARRQRYEERRMLCAVQELDHPGVLADMEAACSPFRC